MSEADLHRHVAELVLWYVTVRSRAGTATR
jgi:hypothetical protein